MNLLRTRFIDTVLSRRWTDDDGDGRKIRRTMCARRNNGGQAMDSARTNILVPGLLIGFAEGKGRTIITRRRYACVYNTHTHTLAEKAQK